MKMEDLLKEIQKCDLCDQQNLLASLITSSPPDVQLSLLLPTVTASSRFAFKPFISYLVL